MLVVTGYQITARVHRIGIHWSWAVAILKGLQINYPISKYCTRTIVLFVLSPMNINVSLTFLVLCCRLGESDECAGTVSFLVSDDARYITGETIVVSGGLQSRL